jgi:hypothetical protein
VHEWVCCVADTVMSLVKTVLSPAGDDDETRKEDKSAVTDDEADKKSSTNCKTEPCLSETQ